MMTNEYDILETVINADTKLQLVLNKSNEHLLLILSTLDSIELQKHDTHICLTKVNLYFPVMSILGSSIGILSSIGYQDYLHEYGVIQDKQNKYNIETIINMKTTGNKWSNEIKEHVVVGNSAYVAKCPYNLCISYQLKGSHYKRFLTQDVDRSTIVISDEIGNNFDMVFNSNLLETPDDWS